MNILVWVWACVVGEDFDLKCTWNSRFSANPRPTERNANGVPVRKKRHTRYKNATPNYSDFRTDVHVGLEAKTELSEYDSRCENAKESGFLQIHLNEKEGPGECTGTSQARRIARPLRFHDRSRTTTTSHS
jgi:hypothetical protein